MVQVGDCDDGHEYYQQRCQFVKDDMIASAFKFKFRTPAGPTDQNQNRYRYFKFEIRVCALGDVNCTLPDLEFKILF